MTNVDTNKQTKINELARRIRTARRYARLSQDALGQSIGLSDKSISSYEKGRSVPPLIKLKKIAASTHRPLSYFTQEEIGEDNLTSRLLSIERELTEVKKLLKKTNS